MWEENFPLNPVNIIAPVFHRGVKITDLFNF